MLESQVKGHVQVHNCQSRISTQLEHLLPNLHFIWHRIHLTEMQKYQSGANRLAKNTNYGPFGFKHSVVCVFNHSIGVLLVCFCS